MKLPSKPAVWVCALALLLLASSCSQRVAISAEESAVRPFADRNPAPDFELRDIDGKTVTLADYRGQVVLLNFWATWCAPCKIEMPWFVEFEKMHKDKGFSVIGISLDEDGWDQVKPYLERAKLNYRILMGNEEVAMRYGGVDALPTSFLIDREGRIASVHVGLKSRSDFENDINVLLNDPSQTASLRGDAAAILGAD